MPKTTAMRRKNLILRYFGFGILAIGIGLNVKMYVNQEWPTYLFFIMCFVGLIQIILSYLAKQIKGGWQIFWSLIPFILGFIYLKI
jgi:hypothetical protein